MDSCLCSCNVLAVLILFGRYQDSSLKELWLLLLIRLGFESAPDPGGMLRLDREVLTGGFLGPPGEIDVEGDPVRGADPRGGGTTSPEFMPLMVDLSQVAELYDVKLEADDGDRCGGGCGGDLVIWEGNGNKQKM